LALVALYVDPLGEPPGDLVRSWGPQLLLHENLAGQLTLKLWRKLYFVCITH